MADLIVKYIFQNEKDTTYNHILLNSKKYRLVTVKDITSLMLSHDLIDSCCYLRFKDYMDDQFCWVDIRNDMAPFPINRNGEVEIKILRVPYKLFDDTNERLHYDKVKQSKRVEKKERSKSPLDRSLANKRSHTANEITQKRQDHFKDNIKDRIGLDSAMITEEGYEMLNDEPNMPKKGVEASDFDFFNEKSIKIKVEKPKKDSFDILNDDHATDVKTIENDLFNLEFSNTHYKPVNINSREQQVQIQADKMRSANILEPMVKTWAYNNTVRKDIRTLLSTLDQVLWKGFDKWTFVSLSDILSDAVLRSKIRDAKIKFHPDKNTELPPDKLYLLERIVSEINGAYKDYQKLN